MRTLLRLFVATSVAGLLPCNAFAIDDNDVQRALKAEHMNDYGFTDMVIFCDHLTKDILSNTSLPKQATMFADNKYTHQERYKRGHVNYFVNIIKMHPSELRSRPLYRKIYSQWSKLFSQAIAAGKKVESKPYLGACNYIAFELMLNAQPTEQQLINIEKYFE